MKKFMPMLPLYTAPAFAFVALMSAVASSSPASAQMALLPHRAIYELKLGPSTNPQGESITGARGRLVYEFTGNACEGYVTNYRQVTEIATDETEPRILDVHTSTWEEGKGKAFRFATRSSTNAKVMQNSEGTAELAGDGGLSLVLKKPKRLRVDLAQNAIFPIEHTRRLIMAANKGERSMAVEVYDGSETGEKIYDTTAIIGKKSDDKPNGGLETSLENAGFSDVARWPVTISYFEKAEGDRQPSYTMRYNMLENGVASQLKFDFGSFSLLGELVKIEKLPPGECTK